MRFIRFGDSLPFYELSHTDTPILGTRVNE